MTDFPESVQRLLAREGTNISWAHFTFNPWIGCTKVSPACDNCYAEALATTRLGVEWGPGAERRHTAASTWSKVRRWQNVAAAAGVRLRVFCASLADWADNAVPAGYREELAGLIRQTPNLDWLMLTKRIGNAPGMLGAMFDFDIPPNVYVGATIANQEEWTRDVSKVAQVAVLIGKHRTFLSMEPLLGPINLDDSGHYRWQGIIGFVIVGGESGTGARPMHPAWPLEIGDQCWQAGVRFHFKQWGEWIAPEDMDPAVRAGLRAGRSAPTVHQFPDGLTMMRVGTAKAGRLLAGREWQELPA